MPKPVPLRAVAVLSLAFTYLFFFEYLPPVKRVHIPYDLEGYYYPLADYAFQQLRDGRFPQWDAAVYCGMTFAGNIQAALFYPATWLLFAANAGRHALLYKTLEIAVLLHVWLAFLLCFVWLRRKGLADLASVLGAGVFAFSGYVCQHLQHYGVVTGYAWMPLAFWGIDQANEQRSWRPLWKVAAASALCILAGYVPLWFTFAVCLAAYAAWHWKTLVGVIAALAVSLALAAVQLLPTWQATAMKTPELNYGTGIRDPQCYWAYLLPNYPNWNLSANGRREDQYLYLGAAGLLGLCCALRSRDRRAWTPAVMALVALVFITNPFRLVWAVIQHSTLLAQVCRDWYFLAGLNLAAAPLAAFGLDYALKRKRRSMPAWAGMALAILLAAWSVRQLVTWTRGGFATGWWSAWEVAATLALYSAALYVLPALRGGPRLLLATALLMTAGVDYKVFGTSRRFDAGEGQASWTGRVEGMPALDEPVYRRLRADARFRVAVDLFGPFPSDLRHFGLSTPQGSDPFLTRNYQQLIERIGRFRNHREIDLDPRNREALHLLGVRYFITAGEGPLYPYLSASREFRLVQPSEEYYKVFEFLDTRPPYGWVSDEEGTVGVLARTPEKRSFVVRSETGGRFALSEQFFPGWQARIDGTPAPLEPWSGAFQSVQVPPGEHRVEFRYRTRGLLPGAGISAAALLLLAAVALRRG